MSYLKRFLDLLQSYGDLKEKQKQLDVEFAKLHPIIVATYNALSDREKMRVHNAIENAQLNLMGGLKEAVLMALDAKVGQYLTPPEVRDYLETIGFDFGTSAGRGLAPITTTLKRMVPDEVEAKPLAGNRVGYRSRTYDAKALLDAETRKILRKSNE